MVMMTDMKDVNCSDMTFPVILETCKRVFAAYALDFDACLIAAVVHCR